MPTAEYTYTLMLGNECLIERDFTIEYDFDDGDFCIYDVLAGGRSIRSGDESTHKHLYDAVVAKATEDQVLIERLMPDYLEHRAYRKAQAMIDGWRTY